jgi:ATP-dependent DNA helicase 2 subunit 2
MADGKVPFAEDMRPYTFAPLDKVVTMKGKVLTKHRSLPTEEQDEAMSEYVDSMNLMTVQRDEEGYTYIHILLTFSNSTEYLRPEDTYSPLLHRINQVIGYRAVHPNAPLPPPTDILTKYSHPPEDLVKGTEKVLQKLIESFNVKKGISFCTVLIFISSPTKTCKTEKGGRS